MARLVLRHPTWRKKAGEEIEATGETAEALVRNRSARRLTAVKKAEKAAERQAEG